MAILRIWQVPASPEGGADKFYPDGCKKCLLSARSDRILEQISGTFRRLWMGGLSETDIVCTLVGKPIPGKDKMQPSGILSCRKAAMVICETGVLVVSAFVF